MSIHLEYDVILQGANLVGSRIVTFNLIVITQAAPQYHQGWPNLADFIFRRKPGCWEKICQERAGTYEEYFSEGAKTFFLIVFPS